MVSKIQDARDAIVTYRKSNNHALPMIEQFEKLLNDRGDQPQATDLPVYTHEDRYQEEAMYSSARDYNQLLASANASSAAASHQSTLQQHSLLTSQNRVNQAVRPAATEIMPSFSAQVKQ